MEYANESAFERPLRGEFEFLITIFLANHKDYAQISIRVLEKSYIERIKRSKKEKISNTWELKV